MATLEAPYPSELYKWPIEVCVLGRPGLVRAGVGRERVTGEGREEGQAQDRARPDEEALVIHQELFLCFRISHPNIVALEDVHESPSHLYLAMEL